MPSTGMRREGSVDYVVFFRLVGLEQDGVFAAADRIAAVVSGLSEVVSEEMKRLALDGCRVGPSVFGRFAIVPEDSPRALDLAIAVRNGAAEKGIVVTVGVAVGPCEGAADPAGETVVGCAVNRAARLACVEAAPGPIAVDNHVRDDASNAAERYGEKRFGGQLRGSVKRTKLDYFVLSFEASPLTEPAPTTASPGYSTPTHHCVVYDIERFTELPDDQAMREAAEGLSRKVLAALKGLESPAGYCPGGDGGALIFRTPTAAWRFATGLQDGVSHLDSVVRIGVATAPVVYVEGAFPVGAAVLLADRVSAGATKDLIAVTERFWWKSLRAEERAYWRVDGLAPADDSLLVRRVEEERPPTVVARYREWAASQFDQLDFIGVGAHDVRLPMEDVFVRLRILAVTAEEELRFGSHEDGRFEPALAQRLGSGERDFLDLARALELAEEEDRHLAIFGEPGAGKTTALRWLGHTLLVHGHEKLSLSEGTLPVLIRLRAVTETDLQGSLGSVLDRELSGAGLRELGSWLWARGRLLLLLDGLDELPNTNHRAAVCTWIRQQLSSEARSGVRAVLSCRRAGYAPAEVRLEPGFRMLDVTALDDEQMTHLAHQWYEAAHKYLLPGAHDVRRIQRESAEEAQRLLGPLLARDRRGDRLRRLADTPLMLTLLCVTALRSGILPNRRVETYGRALETLLERARRKGLATPMDTRDAEELLAALAWRLHRQGRSTDMSEAEFVRFAARRLAGLRTHRLHVPKAKALLDWLLVGAGVLVEYAPDQIGFRHLALQEYLAARHAARQVHTGSSAPEKDPHLGTLAGRFGQEWWREVLLLFVAQPGHALFAPLFRMVLVRDHWTEHRQTVADCIDEAHAPDFSPFAELISSKDKPEAVRVEALRLFLRRPAPCIVEAAGGVRAGPGSDLEAVARAVVAAAAAERLPAEDPFVEAYDVMLCTAPEDIGAAESIARELERRGKVVWYEGWEVSEVVSRGQQLEQACSGTRGAAVLLGPSGRAPWEAEDLWSCVEKLASRDRPIVSVGLGRPVECAALPPLLQTRAAISLAAEGDAAGLDELVARLEHMPVRAPVAPVRKPDRSIQARATELVVEPDTGLQVNFTKVPGGEFDMGGRSCSRESFPVHRVQISTYFLGTTPVTNAEYSAFLEATQHREPPYWRDRCFRGGAQPAVGVSWHDATAFCEWLSEASGKRIELPTEAQWEFAARGPKARPYPWGHELPDPSRADYGGRGRKGGPQVVGSCPRGAGPFGHLDLAGSVWEWCRDPWDPQAYAKRADVSLSPDPIAKGDPAQAVLRGGSWAYDPAFLRCAVRFSNAAEDRYDSIGFRVALITSGS